MKRASNKNKRKSDQTTLQAHNTITFIKKSTRHHSVISQTSDWDNFSICTDIIVDLIVNSYIEAVNLSHCTYNSS